ncbi:hypothetical protein GCM10008905_13720 [Clostridium malenominatum]|uniref:Uncharacterized protein n=1 Tax=Clostridium malenominatum TaxID=1539 RepID=A0ABN1IVR2_9CLOT
MLFNIIFGLIVPWLTVGVFLFIKEKKIIFYIVPFVSVISYIENTLTYQFGFNYIAPKELSNLSQLLTDIGYFALVGGLFIYAIERLNVHVPLIIFIFSIISTATEYPFVLVGKIIYENGWNFVYTFFSYLIPYVILYCFYYSLKKLNLY